jgi:hypothetical protein
MKSSFRLKSFVKSKADLSRRHGHSAAISAGLVFSFLQRLDHHRLDMREELGGGAGR